VHRCRAGLPAEILTGDYRQPTADSAGVFASGTISWIAHLATPCGTEAPCVSTAVDGVTRNLLVAFGAAQAFMNEISAV